MFGLLYNLYRFVQKKNERKVTLITLGLDGAGKTTVINTIQGELEKEVSPTFGFNAQTLKEGKFKIEIFDVGGSSRMRRIWKEYLSEVHGVVYVVDAADVQRFEESRKVLEEVIVQAHLYDKPLLVFANKQDLPTAATAADVAMALGLNGYKRNRFNILGCTAKTQAGMKADPHLHNGIRWLVDQIHSVFSTLDPRVQEEAAIAKAEELRKKKEREEMAKKLKEERLRKLEEDKLAAEAAPVISSALVPTNGDQAEQYNALALLPNQIESPAKVVNPSSQITSSFSPASVATGAGGRGVTVGGSGAQTAEFSDLQRPDQGNHIVGKAGVSITSTPFLGEPSSTTLAQGPHTSTPPRPPVRQAPNLNNMDQPAASASGRFKTQPLQAASMQRVSGSGRPESVSSSHINMQRQVSITASSEGRSRRGSLSGTSFANKVVPEPKALGNELG